MIRIDFTSDSEGTYAGSVYYTGGKGQHSLNMALHQYARDWRIDGSDESFPDYLVRHRTDFLPKTSEVLHFAL